MRFCLDLFTLTTTQLTEIRRMLGYPDLGASNAGGQLLAVNTGYGSLFSYFRVWEPYAWLETRMLTLTTDEEVALFGAEHPNFASYLIPATTTLIVSTPGSIATGVEFQCAVDGSLLTYTTVGGDTPASVAKAMVALISQDANASTLVIATPETANIVIYSRTQGALGNGIKVQATSSDPSLLVQISGIGSAAQQCFGLTVAGTDPPGIQWTPVGALVPIYGYVPTVRFLEADLANSRSNLATLEVDVIKRRPSELLEREWLINRFKREIADRLNVPLNPDFANNRRRSRQRVY